MAGELDPGLFWPLLLMLTEVREPGMLLTDCFLPPGRKEGGTRSAGNLGGKRPVCSWNRAGQKTMNDEHKIFLQRKSYTMYVEWSVVGGVPVVPGHRDAWRV